MENPETGEGGDAFAPVQLGLGIAGTVKSQEGKTPANHLGKKNGEFKNPPSTTWRGKTSREREKGGGSDVTLLGTRTRVRGRGGLTKQKRRRWGNKADPGGGG